MNVKEQAQAQLDKHFGAHGAKIGAGDPVHQDRNIHDYVERTGLFDQLGSKSQAGDPVALGVLLALAGKSDLVTSDPEKSE